MTQATELDLGPLTWVKGEIDQALARATEALAKASQSSEALSHVQFAQTHLHQACGALSIVGLDGLTQFAQSLDQFLGMLVRGERPADASAMEIANRGLAAIGNYLEELVRGTIDQPMRLQSLYEDIAAASGATHAAAVDLFFPDLSLRPPRRTPLVPDFSTDVALLRHRALRSQFERGLLQWLRHPDDDSATKTMRNAAQGFAALLPNTTLSAIWSVASAFFDALTHNDLPAEPQIIKICAQLHKELRQPPQSVRQVPEKLLRTLLFWVSQAPVHTERQRAVRAIWRLDALLPEAGSAVTETPLAPLLKTLHGELSNIKRTWDEFCIGRAECLPRVESGLGTLSVSAEQLKRPTFDRLLSGMRDFVEWLRKDPLKFNDGVALEFATALLLAEVSLDRGVPEVGFSAQVTDTLNRLGALARGETVQAAEHSPTVETARRLQEREARAQVSREMLWNLAQIEQTLDDFFRNQEKRAPLSNLAKPLKQIEGALNMIGDDQAIVLIRDAAETVARFASTDDLPIGDEFEQLAQNLSALGLYIQGLQHGQSDLDRFLNPDAPRPRPAESTASRQARCDLETAPPGGESSPTTTRDVAGLEMTKADAAAVDEDAPSPASLELANWADTLIGNDDNLETARGEHAATAAFSGRTGNEYTATPAARPHHPDGADEGAIDAELLEIFIEEAHEVLATVAEQLAVSRAGNHEMEPLVAIRRGFHTLKGSGRMVGLHELGEASWGMEQTLNRWLQLEWDATPELHELIEQAHQAFSDWVHRIESGQGHDRDVTELMARAEHLRNIGPPEDQGGAPTPVAAPPSGPDVAETSQANAVGIATATVPGDITEADVEVLEFALGDEAQSVSKAPADEPEGWQTEFSLEELDEIPAVEPVSAEQVFAESVAADAAAAENDAEATLVFDLSDDSEPNTDFLPDAQADEAIADQGTSRSLASQVAMPGESNAANDVALTDVIDLEIEVCEAEAGPPDGSIALEPVADQAEAGQAAQESSPPFEFSSETLQPEPMAPVEPEPEPEPEFAIEIEPDAVALEAEAGEAEDLADLDTVDEIEIIDLVDETEAAAETTAEETADEPRETAVEARSTAPGSESSSVRLGETEISRPLFDLYLAEARTHIDALRREFGQLTRNPLHAPSELALRSSHTLAGISGTARATPVFELARALEHAIERLQDLNLAPEPEQTDLLCATVDTLESMLDEVTNCVLPLPSPELEQQLASVGRQLRDLAPPDTEAISESPESATTEGFAMPRQAESAEPEPAPAPSVHDDLDEQLLPIFIEEGSELLSQLQGALRGWQDDRTNAEPAKPVARLLHTLKGSARMAGAMRLGEHVHELESRLEQALQADRLPGGLIDELVSGLDLAEQMVRTLAGGEPALAVQAEEVPASRDEPQAAAPAVTIEAGAAEAAAGAATLRVRADAVDRFVNEAGEIGIARTRIEGELRTLRRSMLDLTENVIRLRNQLREVEIQAEMQMQSRIAQAESLHAEFDPLEMDRYTRLQELTRMMAESVGDVTTVQQSLLRNLDGAELALHSQARLSRDLQQALMQVRMVPFDSLADRLHRVVRQSAKELGKRANLDIRGGRIEIDRSVLERMTAPLEHLLRNAVAHGIEPPEERREAGKDEFGQISLAVSHEGNEIVIALADDGIGLDYETIEARARERGLLEADELADERRLTNLIFLPGFSTASTLSAVSGRGVGMDVVKAEAAAVGGRIDVHALAGRGAEFRIYLPLTLAVTQALLVRAASRSYAIPSNIIAQVVELKTDALDKIRHDGGTEWQGRHFPYRYLPHLLGHHEAQPEAQRFNWLLLLRSGTQTLALHIDALRGNQEIVVKNAGPQLVRIVGVSGATLLGDGEILLILNPLALASRRQVVPEEELAPPGTLQPEAAEVHQPTVLVVDDSLTVRKITSRLLEREGYRVITAKDGSDALEKLLDVIPDVILSDIEMPRMDGFDLVRNIRSDVRTQAVPVIMITSRLAEKHRLYAEKVGANHYLGKPFEEEELLALLRHYTGRVVDRRAAPR